MICLAFRRLEAGASGTFQEFAGAAALPTLPCFVLRLGLDKTRGEV